MAHIKGNAKTPGSGRKKGTPNKRSGELVDMAKRLGVEPFEIMLLFAKGDWKALGYSAEKYVSQIGPAGSTEKYHIDPDTRLDAASQCSKYLYPQLKSTEVKVHTDPNKPQIIKLKWADEDDGTATETENAASEEDL